MPLHVVEDVLAELDPLAPPELNPLVRGEAAAAQEGAVRAAEVLQVKPNSRNVISQINDTFDVFLNKKCAYTYVPAILVPDDGVGPGQDSEINKHVPKY